MKPIKRIIALLLTLLLLATAVPTAFAAKESTYLSYYAPVLQQYQDVLKHDFYRSTGGEGAGDYVSQMMLTMHNSYYSSSSYAKVYYSFYDVDKNGIPELFVSDNTDSIYAVYTYKKGTAYECRYTGETGEYSTFLVDEIGYRSGLHIYANGVMVLVSSYGSAVDWQYIKFNKDGITVRFVTTLSCEFTDPYTYYCNGKKVSKAKADAVAKELTGEGFTVINGFKKEVKLNWKVLDPNRKIRQTQTITGPKSSYRKTLGNKAFNLNAAAKTKLTYRSSDKTVAAVNSNGKVTLKGIGTAKITITAAATDKFSKATKTVTVKVFPAATAFTAVTRTGNTTATLKWTPVTGATGYKIQFASNKNMTDPTAVKVKGGSKNSCSLTGLPRGTCYVRIIAYTNVGGTLYHSAWSAVKTV